MTSRQLGISSWRCQISREDDTVTWMFKDLVALGKMEIVGSDMKERIEGRCDRF